MTLYKYYGSKIAILQTLWGVVFQELFAGLNKKLETLTSPKDRLRISSQHYVSFWLANPEHYRMVFMAEGVTQSEVSLFVGNPEIAAGFDLFHRTIAEASTTGNAKLLKLKHDLLIAALHGIAHNKITISGHPWSDNDAMIEQLIEKLI